VGRRDSESRLFARFEVRGRWQLRIFIPNIDCAGVFGFNRSSPDR
jgi:hypothetical protein